MSRKRLRNHLQNLALVLLTLSALFLLSRLSLLQNIRLPAQTLFSTAPSSGGPEEDALPAAMFPAVSLMITGDSQYGRYGRLCLRADDDALQAVASLFQEALGSAGLTGEAGDDALRSALDGPGLYLEPVCGALPLEAVAAWLGGEADFSLNLRAMALTAGEGDSASLYLLDGEGKIFSCNTALPSSAVQSVCDGFPPNGAYFSYETGYITLEPYTVLRREIDELPDVQAELPAGYSAYNLLTALDFNAHTLSRYTESSGAEVVEESPRTLRISPDGTVTFTSRWQSELPLYRASGQGLRETLAAAWRLAEALTEGTGASPLHLWSVEEGEEGTSVSFCYQLEGVPIRFSDESAALTVVFRDGNATSFTYRCRIYTPLEEEAPRLIPVSIAQAIAAGYPDAKLSVGYKDDGSGRLSAQWLR